MRAKQGFIGEQIGDLPFRVGEVLTVIEPSELLYWYKARNGQGQEGLVPKNFLEPVEAPPLPAKHVSRMQGGDRSDDSSISTSTTPFDIDMIEEAKLIRAIQEREKAQRLKAGTLVVGRAKYMAVDHTDLSFDIGEEMQILRPMPDLGWYFAKKLDKSGKAGAIPITHVRLVYDSDNEDESIYNFPKNPGHDRLYDDINQFISESGWFTFSGFAPGKVALLHVLARKAFMEYGEFMQIKEAVYVLMFGQDEKVFVGKALVLHEELSHHFTCFGKKRQEIREIDDELCHHTGECQWSLKVFPVAPPLSLEVEWAKKVVEKGSLMSVNDTHGVNEQLTFTSFDSWKQFSDWFFP